MALGVKLHEQSQPEDELGRLDDVLRAQADALQHIFGHDYRITLIARRHPTGHFIVQTSDSLPKAIAALRCARRREETA